MQKPQRYLHNKYQNNYFEILLHLLILTVNCSVLRLIYYYLRIKKYYRKLRRYKIQKGHKSFRETNLTKKLQTRYLLRNSHKSVLKQTYILFVHLMSVLECVEKNAGYLKIASVSFLYRLNCLKVHINFRFTPILVQWNKF